MVVKPYCCAFSAPAAGAAALGGEERSWDRTAGKPLIGVVAADCDSGGCADEEEGEGAPVVPPAPTPWLLPPDRELNVVMLLLLLAGGRSLSLLTLPTRW